MKQFYITFFLLLGLNFTISAQNSEVGSTPGELSVTLSGAANYTMPVSCPPGINGVVPQISLMYNSQSGNGNAGYYGWNIGGISTIQRIASTKFHDGVIDPVDFDNLDRFSLDGNRLIIKNGTSGNYGADQTIYETENFSNIKITSLGVHPNGANYGPAYFKVEYPDGSKAFYGNSTDSRSITEWSITYWENAQGVRINYNYSQTNNILDISSVTYGSLSAATPINEIRFNYGTRIRPEQGYVGGQSFSRTKKLTSINVIGNGVKFKNYVIDYNTTSLNYEQLTYITEKNGDSTKSYPPTAFYYAISGEVIQPKPTVSNTPLGSVNSKNAAAISGDFDGDGNVDFALYPTTGTNQKKEFWLFKDVGSSSFTYPEKVSCGAFENIFPSSGLLPNGKMYYYKGVTVAQLDASDANAVNFNTYFNSTYGFGLENTKKAVFPRRDAQSCYDYLNRAQEKFFFSGDFNGDGLTDVIALDKDINEWACEVDPRTGESESYSFSSSTGKMYFVDLDRRKTDNFVNDAGTLPYYYNSSDSRMETFDVNGDGKTDLLHFMNGKVYVYSLNNNNQIELLFQFVDTDIKTAQTILPGDYNGDGKMDFIITKSAGATSYDYLKFLSTGTAFVKSPQTYLFANMGYTDNSTAVNTCDLIPLDINADGKTDIVQFRSVFTKSNSTGSALITVYKNLGSEFRASATPTYQTTASTAIKSYPLAIFLSPKTNNQYSSIGLISDSQIYAFDSKFDFSAEYSLSVVKNGNGVRKIISYSPLKEIPDQSFYTPTPFAETFPYIDIVAAPNYKIVTKLEQQSANANDNKKQLFGYAGAVSRSDGLGFLGFKSTTRTNWHSNNGRVISTVSKRDISLRGAEIESFSVLDYQSPLASTPSSFVSRSVFTYNNDVLQSNKVFKLKNTSSAEYNGLDGTSKEISTSYNQFNLPLTVTTVLKDGGAVTQTASITTSYNTENALPYYVGVPSGKTETLSVTGSVMSSEEQYEYKSGNYGLLEKIRKKGDASTSFVTEKNDYDNFGNIIKKTITAGNLTPREYSFVYDVSGRFIIKSTDVNGLFKTYDYNLSSGVLNSEVNEFNLSTSYTYDSWFKKLTDTNYLGKSNTYTYSRSAEKIIITKTGDDSSSLEETYDDLGRKIKVKVKDVTGNFSSVDYAYDIYNRNYKISEPYLSGSASLYNETEYDEYGRFVKSTSSTGKMIKCDYTPLTTKSTITENSKSKEVTKNAMGKIVSVTDTPGGSVYYTYFANGNLRKTEFSGAVSEIFQDGWGRKTELKDSSAGIFRYEYNDFGELTKETNANGVTDFTIDDIGRIKDKTVTGNAGTSSSKTYYTYEGNSKLLVKSKFDDLANSTSTINDFTYDSLKRIITTVETTPYAQFTKNFTYDGFGRIATETSTALAGASSTSKIEYKYSNGTRWKILDGQTGAILWQTNTLNAKGQILTALNGPVAITNSYDSNGYASQFKFDQAATPTNNLLTLNTAFDGQKGVLNSRTNSLFNWNETFKYDSADRLIEFTNASGNQEGQSYDDLGRITQNNLGTYNYNSSDQPYRNTSIDPTQQALTYYSGRPSLVVSYNTFKTPIEIEEAGVDRISFIYNDNNMRSGMFYGGLQNEKTLRQYQKHYSADGTMEIKLDKASGAVEFVTYIGGDAYSAPLVLKSDGTTPKYLYLLRDYQNSIVAVSDQSGTIVEKRLFDAWGNIIAVKDGSGIDLGGLTILDRGYTGHEHLQSVGLINMNARLYDPKLHRFMQPDNFIQDIYNTQNHNRYSYVLNNPLMYTDFTGEKFKITFNDILAAVEIVGGAVLTLVTSGVASYAGGALIASGIAHFAGAYSEYQQTGDWGAASNNAGFVFGIKWNTDWGYDSDDKSGLKESVDDYIEKTNWYGVVNAGVGVLGGGVEVVAGLTAEGFTAGFSTALVVDGVYRIAANSARLGMYLSHEEPIADAFPSNSGALLGKLVDGMNGAKPTEVGKMQLYYQVANDLGVFFVTLGNGGAYVDAFYLRPGFWSYSAIGTNWYTIIDYRNMSEEYKKNKNK